MRFLRFSNVIRITYGMEYGIIIEESIIINDTDWISIVIGLPKKSSERPYILDLSTGVH